MTASAPIESLIAAVADKPFALTNLARTLLVPKGDLERARELCEQAVALAPHDGKVRAAAAEVMSINIGSWYFTMVQDHLRHKLYEQAFKRIIKPGSRVLDIGAGTGLFAMMAARAGAAEVIACERDPAVAKAAAEAVAANGLSAKVRMIAKDVVDLKIGVDMDGPCDVLLWDNLANNLIGAGAIPTLEDARARLTTADVVVIPCAAEIKAALVEYKKPDFLGMGMVEGFDLSAFNKLARPAFTAAYKELDFRSEAVSLYDFDFQNGGPFRGEDVAIPVKSGGGRVDGVAQWIDFKLTAHEHYDTGAPQDVWAFGIEFNAVQPFETRAGDVVNICASHDRLRTLFWATPA